jgi:hypothetical protein
MEELSSRSLNIGSKTVLQNEAASKLPSIALIHVSKHRLQCMAAIFRLGSAGEINSNGLKMTIPIDPSWRHSYNLGLRLGKKIM